MPDQPQQVYNGRYRLDRRIARGGMADVFLARDLLLDRPVALKVLFPEFATDPAFVERFRREAQSAARLSHPNIVSVYDWGEEDGTYFIVMEYIEGQSLAQVLSAEGALRPELAADIAADTASALHFAHGNGVIHRDVKPGNILISPNGSVKVTDFGIARAVTTAGNLTQTGTVMGTATYFSPEQARGETVGPASDVYSLGVVLYEMLTGRPPFSGDNPVSVAYKHVQETPEPPRARDRDIPAALEAVVLTALAKDQASRYATADDLRADLRRFRAGREVMAGAMAAQPTAATRSVSAGAGATTAVPAADGTRQVRRVEEAYAAHPPSGPPPERRSSAAFVVVLLVLLAVLAALLVLFAQSLGLGSDPVQVVVPSVVSLGEAEATDILVDAGLEPEVVEVPNAEWAAGTVFAQAPEAGASVEEGSAVQLQVSSGAPPVAVPDLVGSTVADAVSQLEGLGLVPDVVEVADDDEPAGQVLRQDPDDGEEVPAGSTVTIEVSAGPEPVPVPDVVGMSSNEAGVQLGRAGFEVAFREEASDAAAAGTVVRTEPSVGTELEPGTTVTVVVSSGPATVPVPEVVGDPTDDAVDALEDAGFEVDQASQAVTNPSRIGVVLSQSPAPGTRVAPGTTVTITVGERAPAPTTTTSGGGGGGGGGGGNQDGDDD